MMPFVVVVVVNIVVAFFVVVFAIVVVLRIFLHSKRDLEYHFRTGNETSLLLSGNLFFFDIKWIYFE